MIYEMEITVIDPETMEPRKVVAIINTVTVKRRTFRSAMTRRQS